MPSRNSRKIYQENSYYHLYNRGVEKRRIFLDQQDYAVFLSYLKEYLLPKDEKSLQKRLSDPLTPSHEKDKILKSLRLNNFSNDIILLAYCLMPNHFHFFVKQRSSNAIDTLMNSLGTRYTMYFNNKYKRVGTLYEGTYKAVQVNNESQFIYLSKYIHKQALALQGDALQAQPTSYDDYLGKRQTDWVKPTEVLSYFSKNNASLTYQSFVEELDDLADIQDIQLDKDF
ncbi:MAG: transposase [Candidatus Levybacteria bacterium]|nr:transposase [Candidatus Levybacteria bacterium]